MRDNGIVIGNITKVKPAIKGTTTIIATKNGTANSGFLITIFFFGSNFLCFTKNLKKCDNVNNKI